MTSNQGERVSLDKVSKVRQDSRIDSEGSGKVRERIRKGSRRFGGIRKGSAAFGNFTTRFIALPSFVFNALLSTESPRPTSVNRSRPEASESLRKEKIQFYQMWCSII